MPTIYRTWTDEGEDTAYPFEDTADLQAAGLNLSGIFADAVLYSAVSLTEIKVTESSLTFTLDSGASASCARTPLPASLSFLSGSIPGGLMVFADGAQELVSLWATGTYTVTAAVVATCRVPGPEGGLKAILADGHRFTGDVYILGEQGVRLTYVAGKIQADVIGDTRAKARFCDVVGLSLTPAVRKIEVEDSLGNILSFDPPADGDFKVLVGSQQVSVPSLQISNIKNGIQIGRRA